MKKIERNSFGFTLTELIVVIAIMGVILILALPQVANIQRANKDSKYETYQKSLETAAKLYVDSNTKDLFGYDSGCIQIKYSDLKKANLIKDFGDSEVVCGDDSETFVEVRKVNENYRYASSLVCRDKNNHDKILYSNKESIEGDSCIDTRDLEAPKITFNPPNSDWKHPTQLSVKIIVSDVSGLNKNISIKYYWVNKSTGEKVGQTYTHNYKNKSGVQKVSYTIPNNQVPTGTGQYFIRVQPDTSSSTGVMDMMGNVKNTAQDSGVYKIDNTPPTCVTTGGGDEWSEFNVTLVGHCSDNESGCVDDVKKTFTDVYKDSMESPGSVKDKVGNTTVCPKQRVRQDKTPKTPTIINPTDEKWVNYNFALQVKTTSSSAMIGYWQWRYEGTEWTTYDNSATNTFTTTEFVKEQNEPVYIRVCSKESICSEAASTQIRIDKTEPKISATFTREDNGAVYQSGSLVDVTLIRNINYSDNLSGVQTVQYKTTGGWSTESNLKNYKYTSDTVNQYITFRAIDKAGNIGQTSQYHVRIEKNVDRNYNVGCKATCQGPPCSLNGYNNDQHWTWYLEKAGSGINRSSMAIDYSTDWVHNYCQYNPSNAPYGTRAKCGYAVFNSTTMVYCRSYACSSIVGRACTNKNVCGQCTITDRRICG